MCIGFETSERIPADPTAEDCNFHSIRYLEFIFFMFILTIFSATSWSLVQRSPTDCGTSLCVI